MLHTLTWLIATVNVAIGVRSLLQAIDVFGNSIASARWSSLHLRGSWPRWARPQPALPRIHWRHEVSTLLTVVLAALGGGVVGYGIAAGLTLGICWLFGVDLSGQGGWGSAAIFVIGPVGGLAGMVIGAWLAFHLRANPLSLSAGEVAWRGLFGGAVMAGLVYGAIRLQPSISQKYPEGQEPSLDFEIRVPAQMQIDGDSLLGRINLYTFSPSGGATPYRGGVRQDGDRAVITGSIKLSTRGEWRHVDFVQEPRSGRSHVPTTAEDFDIRYRVSR
jgi:MFS family permease